MAKSKGSDKDKPKKPPQAPSEADKAKPEPANHPRSAAGPEMRLDVAPPKPVEGVSGEDEEASRQKGFGSPFPIVGVGASAGGLEATRELLSSLKTDTGMAFVIVHHLSPEHDSVLEDILGRATQMPVKFATDGLRVEPNHVYVAPPGAFVALFHGTINLMKPVGDRGPRTAIDYFFRSLGEDQRSLSIGVVLSGTGSDGALGIRGIKAEDGITFVQKPETAAYDGMPRAALDTGLVDFVLTVSDIAKELARIAKHPYLRPEKAGETRQKGEEHDQRALERIFLMLRESAGVDFTYYKPATVRRRINRRMVVHKLDRLEDYAKVLNDRPEEVELLYQDLLINVTGFFREAESFEALAREVFPTLLEGRGQADTIRIWVPACSTGEEPYSLAIALHEFLETQPVRPPVQIFATDISDTSIDKARHATYPENIEGDVSAERLSRFFSKVVGGYQLNKTIRDTCVFAKHDVTRDPPFSRLDMISCRNLLIYLGSSLQRRLIPVFHYALNDGGFLFLGSSESVGEHTNLFNLINQKYKIYEKKSVASRPPIEFGFRQYPVGALDVAPKAPVEPIGRATDVRREADRIAIERYVPPAVLITGDLEILQFRGDTSPYLRHASGRASLHLLEMARPGLDTTLRSHINKAKERHAMARVEGVQVRQDGGFRTTDIEIVPLPSGENESYFLVFFREPVQPRVEHVEPGAAPSKRGDDAELEQLRRDLEVTRDQLRLTVEEKDASLEELRAANEEIQSSNEELQSINEELETAKEELQSTNEELTTLNEELQNRNFELQSINDDLRNVLSSVNVPIIILGKDLRIRRYTPMAEKALNLIPGDIGRPVTDLKPKIDVPDLPELVSSVLNDLSPIERWVTDEMGHNYRLQIRPYRTTEDRIEGVVIALLDVGEYGRESGGKIDQVGQEGK